MQDDSANKAEDSLVVDPPEDRLVDLEQDRRSLLTLPAIE